MILKKWFRDDDDYDVLIDVDIKLIIFCLFNSIWWKNGFHPPSHVHSNSSLKDVRAILQDIAGCCWGNENEMRLKEASKPSSKERRIIIGRWSIFSHLRCIKISWTFFSFFVKVARILSDEMDKNCEKFIWSSLVENAKKNVSSACESKEEILKFESWESSV